MSTRESVKQHRCERCGKPTSRLLGIGAGVRLIDPDRVQVRVAALGYCLEHRDIVVPDWRKSLELGGSVEWMPDEAVELRPRDADAFVTAMQRQLTQELGGFEPLEAPHDVPQQCPHCGGRVVWDVGPHAGDIKVLQKKAFAWECENCRSAGLLMMV